MSAEHCSDRNELRLIFGSIVRKSEELNLPLSGWDLRKMFWLPVILHPKFILSKISIAFWHFDLTFLNFKESFSNDGVENNWEIDGWSIRNIFSSSLRLLGMMNSLVFSSMFTHEIINNSRLVDFKLHFLSNIRHCTKFRNILLPVLSHYLISSSSILLTFDFVVPGRIENFEKIRGQLEKQLKALYRFLSSSHD